MVSSYCKHKARFLELLFLKNLLLLPFSFNMAIYYNIEMLNTSRSTYRQEGRIVFL